MFCNSCKKLKFWCKGLNKIFYTSLKVEFTPNGSMQNSSDISLNLIKYGSSEFVIELGISKTVKTLPLSQLSNIYGSIRLTDGIK